MENRIFTTSCIFPMIVAIIVCWVAVMPVVGNWFLVFLQRYRVW